MEKMKEFEKLGAKSSKLEFKVYEKDLKLERNIYYQT